MIETTKVLASLAKQKISQNLLLSPVGLELLLHILTQKEFPQNLLDFQKGTHFKKTIYYWLPDYEVVINSNSSVWHSEKIKPEEKLLEWLGKYPQIELNPKKPFAKETINSWVKEQSKGLISSINTPISHNTFALFLNLIYFKANWKNIFSSFYNTEGPFYLENGKTVQETYMNRGSEYDPTDLIYLESENYESIKYPYIKDGLFMEFYLPKKDVSLNELILSLATTDLKEKRRQYSPRKGILRMPKFSIESLINFSEIIKAIELTKDMKWFQEIEGQFLESIIQTTVLHVNEDGTEAASLTEGAIGGIFRKKQPVVQFILDRPFLFIIRDELNDIDLFAGVKRV
ncbi:MAG: hypothetical protein DWQ02_17990 [Bacteroidetes bacterium]|nr:MAG: hypothetical protein DWQ02_17990 [Bacteroidota bacterium]